MPLSVWFLDIRADQFLSRNVVGRADKTCDMFGDYWFLDMRQRHPRQAWRRGAQALVGAGGGVATAAIVVSVVLLMPGESVSPTGVVLPTIPPTTTTQPPVAPPPSANPPAAPPAAPAPPIAPSTITQVPVPPSTPSPPPTASPPSRPPTARPTHAPTTRPPNSFRPTPIPVFPGFPQDPPND
jgi:hypothetical protein